MGRHKIVRDKSDLEFGARLRSLRRERGLTLVRLAKASGLSNPFLSQIERGKARPSLASLAAIAAALECPVAELLGAPEPAKPVQVRGRDLRRVGFGAGATARRYSVPGRTISTRVIEGAMDWTDELAHPGRELMYVIAGTLTMEVAGRRYRLRAGDAIRFPGPVTHRERTSPGTAILNLVAEKLMTGPGGDDYAHRLASANPEVAASLTAGLPEQIGPRLRFYRRERGLTLQQLASLTGLSEPFLSQVERGRAQLSVESQKAAAAALNIAPVDLWVQHGRGDVYVSRGARAPVHLLTDDPTQAAHARRLASSGPVFRLSDIFGGPPDYGADETAEGWEVMLFVLAGGVQAHVAGREYTLDGGDALSFDGALPYAVRRHGPTDTRWLSILALATA
ncbi:MAG: helix-turn-helix domain-containing protein [Thermoleophilia bacterium]